jgi:replicative superfamily II helicase
MVNEFNYQEALLALTTIVAWADGENQDAEVDARVQMIVKEKISNLTLDQFKIKYDEINDFEKLYNLAINSIQGLPNTEKSRALAWMWQIANVADLGTKDKLYYIEDKWKNKNHNVDLNELHWINRAKKDLKINIDDFKTAFESLPQTNRIL